jgi:hypothetical protein
VSGSLATLTSNAASQAGDLATLTSNAAVQAGNIATIFANLGVVSGNIATLTANAGAQAGILAGLTSYANANVASYLPTYSGNISNLTVTGTTTLSGNITGNTAGFSIGYRDIPQIAAGNVTLALTDAGKHYYSTAAYITTLTVPTNANVGFPIGTAITIVNQGTGNILVANAATVTMYLASNSTASINRTVTSYGMATLLKVATNTWFINGSGVV